MLYLFSRENIVNIIKTKSERTKDGFYFYPYFNSINCLKGFICDNEYYYNRYIFYNKYYFSEYDFNIYLSKKKIDIDLYEYQKKNDRFYEIIKNIKYKDLFSNINDCSYSMNDIIDNYEFKYN